MRLLWIAAAVAIGVVAAMPNVLEFDMEEEIINAVNFIETKEQLIDFVTEGHKYKTQPIKLTGFSFKDCGGANSLININSVMVTPDPLAFPGPLNIAAGFKINSNVGAPMVGDLYIAKKVLGKFVKLPCIDNFGSCQYADLCELMEQVQCPDPIVRIGIDCTCPLKANTYTFPQTEFEVDVSFIPAGDYHMVGNVTYQSKQAACLDITLTFK